MELVLFSHFLPVNYVLNWPAATSEAATGYLLHVTHCCSVLRALVGESRHLKMHLMCRGKAPGLQSFNEVIYVLVEHRNANVLSYHSCKFFWTMLAA